MTNNLDKLIQETKTIINNNLIQEIHDKYLSINDERLRALFLIFVSCAFAQAFIKCINDNKKEIYYEKLN